MTVPYTFATATSSIPLSQLDSNFATAITLGNTAVYLGNTTTSIGNLTLTNTTISSVAVTFPNSYLSNSSVTIGSTSVSLGGTATSIAGLTLTSGAFNGTIGATTPSTAVVTSLTDSGLTAGRVNYNGTGGLLVDSANLTFDGNNLGVGNTSAIFGNINRGVINVNGTSTALLSLSSGASTSTAGYMYWDGSNLQVVNNSTSGALTFNTNAATERMRISSSGNVGIGTSSPSYILDVQSASGNTITGNYDISSSGSSISTMRMRSAGTGAGYWDVNTGNTASGLNGALRWFDNIAGAERMRIDSSGNFLVACTDTSETTLGFKVRTSGIVSVGSAFSTNAAEAYTMYSTTASAYRFYVDWGGTVHATSVVITAISDERLKENIRDIDTGLSAIMSLKPRRFDWKEGKGQDKKNAAGFIAQEFETVFPESVGTSKAGQDGIEYKNINHETLIPTLVKAIQEQQAIIEQLKAKVGI